jgi:hypothetical protein
MKAMTRTAALALFTLLSILGLSGCTTTGSNPVKEIFFDPFTRGTPEPSKAPSSSRPYRTSKPATSKKAPSTSKKAPSTSKKAPRAPTAAERSNLKSPAAYIPFGFVEGFARTSAQAEYDKLKQSRGALSARAPQVVMVNKIVEDLKLAIQKYSRLSNGEFQLEPIDFSTWEVNVFRNQSINANVMPGGKITVYDGILGLAKDDEDAVAVILGHEIAHELLKHARNRATTQIGYTAILAVVESNAGWANDPDKMRTLGTAVNVGGFLPWSRSNESNADHLGAILAAIAGYDISRGEWLWNQMASASKGQAPPEWLSTHPAGQTRVNFFRTEAPKITAKYAKYHTVPLSRIK